MTSDLTRIRDKAGREPKACFSSIYHYVSDPRYLLSAYEKLERGKAPGVDGVTVEDYGRELVPKILDLAKRLGRLGYRPQPVRRHYIPKIGSRKKRPLGIPCTEDKVVQMAVTRVLEQIYEADFLDCSYGYRPGRTCHQALDTLGRTIQQKKVSYVVEADIQGFFDHVNHDWLMKFLRLRIGDRRILRLIWRLLKGGVMEDGLTRASEEGTPQGGVLSPLLSNVYLHYVLDLWFERRFRRQCRGEAYLFRYAGRLPGWFSVPRGCRAFSSRPGSKAEEIPLGGRTLQDETDRLRTVCPRAGPAPRQGTGNVRLSRFHALLRPDALWELQGETPDSEEEVSGETERDYQLAQAGAQPSEDRRVVAASEKSVGGLPQLLCDHR